MEDTNNEPNKVLTNDTETNTTDINKNDSYVNNETHKLNYVERNINETLNSMNTDDIKLKEEEENNSNIKDSAENILKNEEATKFDDDLSNYNDEVLKKDTTKILHADDKDHLKNLNAYDDHKNVNTNESNTVEGSKNLQENDIEKGIVKQNDSINEYDSDAKMDSKDIEEKDVFSGDDKGFKKYGLRQRQKVSYIFDEPPPKKKKNNEKQEEIKTAHECSICYSSYTSKRGLSLHMVSHEQPQRYTCAQCNTEFQTNKELIDHKKVHETDDTIFSCGKCEVAYSNILEYLIHKADHKKSFKQRHCVECGKVFENRHLYKIHLPVHYNVFTYKCDICHKAMKNKITYTRHMRQNHETNTKYICGECGKYCKCQKMFEYHMTTHTGLKLYQCLYCGKGFPSNGMRKVHTRIHTGEKPFECEICKKTFRQSTDLHRHMLDHNAIKLRFICDYCGKSYSRKETLAIHMRIHTRVDLLSCPLCNKKFPLHALLKSHYIYRHTKETPYKCDTCKVSFKRLTHLQRHLKLRKHKNAIYALKKKQRKDKENGAQGK